MSYYCTLADARREVSTTKVSAAEDDKLLRAIWDVSRRIDLELQPDQRRRYPMFAPYKVTDAPMRVMPDRVNSYDGTLTLDSYWIAIDGVKQGTTALTLGTGVETFPPYAAPISELRLLGDCGYWYTDPAACTRSPLFVYTSGIRGYNVMGEDAWLKVDDLVAGISDSVLTLTVADVDGVDPNGNSPRISRGNLLRIGDEFMLVTGTNTDTNVVTVQRHANGTTAAAHSLGADVEVWQTEDPIRRVTARQAGAIYARIGSFEEKTVNEIGLVSYPKDLLVELKAVLQGYAYL